MKMTLEEIEATCNKYCTVWKGGYMSHKIKDGIINEYNSRYGKGYTVETPAYNTTQYHYITYYILKEV